MRMTTLPLLACLLTLAACDKPSVPPDPAAAAAARAAPGHHEIEDAIKEQKKYEDRAKHAGDPALDADKQHDKQLEDSGG